MSPVHVLVSSSAEEERQYVAAFGGAIELYRFASNVEAFERFAGVQLPIDVLVVSTTQDSLFNLSAAQLVSRLTSPPMASNPMLAAMNIYVVGGESPLGDPRVHVVPSLDAVVRHLKFGDVESTPMPTLEPRSPVAQGSNFASGLIASIWDMEDPRVAKAAQAAPQRPPVHAQAQPQAAAQPQRQARPQAPARQTSRVRTPRGTAGMRPAQVSGGGPSASGALFAHSVEQPQTEAPADLGLQPSVPYVLPSRGQYRGAPGSPDRAHYVNAAEHVPGMPVGEQAPQMPQHQAVPALPDPRHTWPHQPREHAPQAYHQQNNYPPAHAQAPQGYGQMPAQPAPQGMFQMQQSAPAANLDPVLGWSADVQAQLNAGDPGGYAQPAYAQPQYAAHSPEMHIASQPMPGGMHMAPMQMHPTAPPAPPAQPSEPSGVRGRFRKMRDNVRATEQAPLVPVAGHHAGYAQAAPMMAAPVAAGAPDLYGNPQPAAARGEQIAGVFDAPSALMERLDGAGSAQFG